MGLGPGGGGGLGSGLAALRVEDFGFMSLGLPRGLWTFGH